MKSPKKQTDGTILLLFLELDKEYEAWDSGTGAKRKKHGR